MKKKILYGFIVFTIICLLNSTIYAKYVEDFMIQVAKIQIEKSVSE